MPKLKREKHDDDFPKSRNVSVDLVKEESDTPKDKKKNKK